MHRSHSARTSAAAVAATVSAMAILVTMIVTAVHGAPAMAQDSDKTQSATITMNATGEVTAVPDMALISTGVVSEAERARDALDANTAAMVAIIRGLREAGVQGRDIQTTDFSVQPRYNRDRDSGETRIDGYRVVNSVRIRVRDIEKLGDVLDVAVDDGSNQISNIRFDVSNGEEVRDEARRRAVDAATQKARIYAEAAGVELGRVMRIAEQGGGQQPQPRMMRTAVAESVPIEAGETTISVGVSMSWELR